MTPEAVRQWQSIFRDIVITLLAAFMLVYETVVAHSPNAYIVGAGLTLMGIPPALRLDSWRRKADESADMDDTPHVSPSRPDRRRRG